MTAEQDELRAHNYITTYTGIRFHFPGPNEELPLEQFCIQDVAHSLSLTCRWRGHTRSFYSVASHSLHVMELAERDFTDPRVLMACLIHDGHEAYLGDVPTPLKWACPQLRQLEDRLSDGLREALAPSCTGQHFEIAKLYDRIALYLEAVAVIRVPWAVQTVFLSELNGAALAPQGQEKAFISAYDHLRRQIG